MDNSGLNNLQMDVLREIGNIGAGNAVTALAKMINKRVDMSVPQVKILDFSEISEILGGAEIPVVGILLPITGDITGYIMFVLEQSAAQMLVNILMYRDIKAAIEYDDMTMSALKEIGNILAGSYLSAISTLTNLIIKPDVPGLAIDMAGAVLSVPAIEFGKNSDTVLYIETEFIEGKNKVLGDFFLIPDLNSYNKLLSALGVM